MKLKFTYKPRKDSNGYFCRLPNGTQKRFKTIKEFDRWLAVASNELNKVLKVLLLQYPFLTELYCGLYIRSNIHNSNRLSFIQKTYDETFIITRILGVIPNRGFYEAYTDMYRLLLFYDELLEVYYQEYTVFSDRFVLAKIMLSIEIVKTQKNKLDEL